MLIIFSPIGHPGVNTSDFQLSLTTVLPAFFRACVPSLSFRQFLFIFGKELRVAVGVPIGSDKHGLQAQIKPYLLIHYRQVFDIFFYQERDKVAIGTVFGDSNRSGFTALRQGTRPVDIKGRIHLGKSKLFAVPGKGIGSIGSRLYSVFLVEGWILSTALKEIPESGIQMPEGLLQWDAGYFRKPGRLFLLLQFSQHNCQLIVVEAFTTLKESISTLSQCPVVDKATTAESTGKYVCLFLCWIHSVLVGFLLFHGLHDSRYVVKNQAVRLSIPTARSRGSFGAFDNLRIYDRLIPYLRDRQVVTFDFLDWGTSDKPMDYPYTSKQQEGDLQAVLDTLEVEQVVLVPHDASGPVAINWALDHPERVTTLVLLNTYFADAPTLRFPEFIALFADPAHATLARAMAQEPNVAQWLLRWQGEQFGAGAPERGTLLPMEKTGLLLVRLA